MATLLDGRAVVAIAHRLHTAHDADRIAVVIDGRIGREAAGQTQCPACARTNAPGAARCLYCGAEIASSILDRRIVKPGDS